MPVRRAVVPLAGALLALALAGCGSDDVDPPRPAASSSQATTPTSAAVPTALPTSSITCSSPEPTGPFTYSTDRDELAALAGLIGDPIGSPNTFDDVDAAELAVLIERGFVDPGGDTNGSPSMWEFHEFLCAHPEARAIGFIAGSLPEDTEAIASLETVYADTISDTLRDDARPFCRTTELKTLRGHLECFWD